MRGRLGTVTSASPLTVTFDGDDVATPIAFRAVTVSNGNRVVVMNPSDSGGSAWFVAHVVVAS